MDAGTTLGELLEQPGDGGPDGSHADRSEPADAAPEGPPSGRRAGTFPLRRPTEPRPDDAAYRYALEVVRYEGGDLGTASPAARETIRRWRDWAAYDAARAGAAGDAPDPVNGPTGTLHGHAIAGMRPQHGPFADSDWTLIVDDLIPYLYQCWKPVPAVQAGHPRRGTTRLANADGTRLSSHVVLWAERHGRRYGWARRLLQKAASAGLIRLETHRIQAPDGSTLRTWSQWVPLEPAAYSRRVLELVAQHEP